MNVMPTHPGTNTIKLNMQFTARFWFIIIVGKLQTQIMHQNLAVILWRLYYGKISFIVFVPVHQKLWTTGRASQPALHSHLLAAQLLQRIRVKLVQRDDGDVDHCLGVTDVTLYIAADVVHPYARLRVGNSGRVNHHRDRGASGLVYKLNNLNSMWRVFNVSQPRPLLVYFCSLKRHFLSQSK